MDVTWSVKCSDKLGDSKVSITMTGLLADKKYVDQVNDLIRSWEKDVKIDIEPTETEEQAKNQVKLFSKSKEIAMQE